MIKPPIILLSVLSTLIQSAPSARDQAACSRIELAESRVLIFYEQVQVSGLQFWYLNQGLLRLHALCLPTSLTQQNASSSFTVPVPLAWCSYRPFSTSLLPPPPPRLFQSVTSIQTSTAWYRSTSTKLATFSELNSSPLVPASDRISTPSPSLSKVFVNLTASTRPLSFYL